MPVYSSAFTGTHFSYPRGMTTDQAELTWVTGIVYPPADGHPNT